MKQYYNTITSDNLKLITSLKTEVKDMREKAQQNKVTTKDVSAENARAARAPDGGRRRGRGAAGEVTRSGQGQALAPKLAGTA